MVAWTNLVFIFASKGPYIMKPLIAFVLGLGLVVSAHQVQSQQLLPNVQSSIGLPPSQLQGGSAWTEVEIGAISNLYGVFFINPDTGWVAGDDGLFNTIDGGLHWSRKSDLGACGKVQFVDQKNGWGLFTQLQHTTNGGATWLPETTFGQHGLTDAVFVNPDSGFACNSFQAGSTLDGGVTWRSNGVYAQGIDAISSSGFPYAYLVSTRLTDSNIAPLHGSQFDTEYTDINRTTDGGLTWKRLDTRLQKDLYSVKALDSLHVVVGGNGLVAVTWDGGKTWQHSFVQSSIQWAVTGFYFFDNLHGFLYGGTGKGGNNALFANTSDGGNTWTQLPIQIPPDSISNSSAINNLIFIDSLDGWLVAYPNRLFHTTTGGVDAVQPEQPTTQILQVTNFPDPFNSTTTITYSLPQLQHVTLQIFDVGGRLIETPLEQVIQTAGVHTLSLDGYSLRAGVYSYKITTEQYSATGKLNLVK